MNASIANAVLAIDGSFAASLLVKATLMLAIALVGHRLAARG